MPEPSEGLIGWVLTILGLRKKSDKQPIQGVLPRIVSLVRCHFRGLLTFIICTAAWLAYGSHENKFSYMFFAMLMLFILKPLAVSTTALLPIFYLPMTGLLVSTTTTKFLNSSGFLWLLGSMMNLLLNATNVDQHVAVKILSMGPYSPKWMVFKASLAAFIMSIFSSRLHVTSKMTSLITPAIMNLEGARNVKAAKNIINNAIATSATFGGFVMVHGAISGVLARSLWTSYNKSKLNWTYAQYTMFTLPVAIAMFIVNLICHMAFVFAKDVNFDNISQSVLKITIEKHKSGLGKMKHRQMIAILHTFLFYATIMSRRLTFSAKNVAGWQPPSHDYEEYSDDVTVIAAFVLGLSMLPSSYNFLKYFTAKTESQLPPRKPESAILWWKYVDKHVIYSYMFLTTSVSVQAVLLDNDDAFSKIQGLYYDLKDMLIARVLICVIASNIMGDAASAFICCLLFSVGQEKQGYDPIEALEKIQSRERYPYLMICAVACNLCFASPFKNTPAYYCRNNGRVPVLRMVIYSLPSIIGCSLVLWVGVKFYIKFTFLNDYVG